MGDQEVPRLSQSVTTDENAADAGDADLVKVFKRLSPDSQTSVQVLMQNIVKGDVYLNLDENGRQILEYMESNRFEVGEHQKFVLGKRKKSYVDASQANIIVKPRTETDVHDKVEACLELIDYLKHDKSPAGVVLDSSKIHINHGQYRDGFEFTHTKQILGSGNSAGDIIVVKDTHTKHKHALKTIMISVFRKHEIQCWVDLAETGYVPCLYLFKIRGNKVDVHMEILKESLTMRSIIDDHMMKLDRSLLKPFSLYVLNGTLEAVSAMHGKNWVHKDLHAGNVMLQKNKEKMLDLKIIDFGMAAHLETPSTGLDFRGFRSDIASVLRIFCGLYVSNEFNSVLDIQKNWRDSLEKVTSQMNKDEKTELFCLVDVAMGIVHPEDVRNYNKTVKEKLNTALSEIGKSEMDVLKEVATILFPEQLPKQVSLDESYDIGHHFDEGDSVSLLPHPAGLVSEDFVMKLRLSMTIQPAALF